HVQNHPDIRKLKVRRRVAVTHGQNASAEYFFIVASRSLDVGDGKKMRDSEALLRWHLIAFLLDLYFVHSTLHNASDFRPLAVSSAHRRTHCIALFRSITRNLGGARHVSRSCKCPLLAQSGHTAGRIQCGFRGVKPTWHFAPHMSAWRLWLKADVSLSV